MGPSLGSDVGAPEEKSVKRCHARAHDPNTQNKISDFFVASRGGQMKSDVQ